MVEPETFMASIAPFSNDKEEAARVASQHTDVHGETSFWTYGSRIKKSLTGASVAKQDLGWRIRRMYHGTNKEVLDVKLYAMGEALGIALQSGATGPPRSKVYI